MSHSKSDLSIYRLERARQDLKAAKKLLDANDTYKASVNRSYYAIFHAIRALLAIDGIDFKKHSAIISYFRKEYVKSGKFDMEYSEIVGNSFNIRNSSDYEDFYLISKKEVEEQIINTERFIAAVEKYLENTNR
jgi:uncharacterized protein (UPF0332 family)